MSGDYKEKYINNVYSEEEKSFSDLSNASANRDSKEFDLRIILAHPDTKKLYLEITNKLKKYPFIIKKETNEFDNYYFKKKELLKVRCYYDQVLVIFSFNDRFIKKNSLSLNKVDDELKPLFNKSLYYEFISEVNKFSELFDKLLVFYKLIKPKFTNQILDKVDEININIYNKKSQEILAILGYNRFLEKGTTVSSAEFPDALALNSVFLVKRKNPGKRPKVKKITVGELSAGFRDNYEINLDLLKEVDMSEPECNYLSVVPMGECKFALNVWADEYDVRSIKMILITKGNVYKYYYN